MPHPAGCDGYYTAVTMKIKCRKLGITTKILIYSLALVIIGDLIVGLMAVRTFSNKCTAQIQNNALSHARCVSGFLDGDLLESLQPGMENTDAWREIYTCLETFVQKSDLEYVYTLRRLGNRVVFIVDADETVVPEINAEYMDISDTFETAFEGNVVAESEFLTDEWGTHMTAYAPVYNSKDQVIALVAVDVNATTIISQVSSFRLAIFGFFGIVILAVATAMIVIRIKLARSFNELNSKVCDLTDGSGDLTRKIVITSGDELEVIANNFNKFIAQIRGLVAAVSETADSVYQSSGTTNQSILLNSQAIEDINCGISNISASLEECSASVEVVVEHLGQTNSELHDYVRSIDDVSNLSKAANVNAEKAKTKAVTHSQDARTTINEMSKNMKRISDEAARIEQIKDIAETISTIAEQTQILSLNAQIEAARAGEYGRGFAVVATDVEKLSYEITAAVDEIKHVNTRVLTAVNEMIASSRNITDFMNSKIIPDYDSFVEIGTEYGNSTKTISTTMRSLKDKSIRFEQILDNIHMNVKDISSTITDSSAAAQEITSSTETISTSMTELSSISSDSSHKSSRLHSTVSRYRYK